MEPLRKPFQLDPIFPFDMVYKGVRRSNNELPDHLHDLFEIVYIHEGKGMFFIDGTLYAKGPGDLFLIPGNTVHRAFPSADEPIVSTAVFFAPSFVRSDSLGDGYDPLKSFELARKRKRYKTELDKPAQTAVEAAIEAMAREMQELSFGHRHAVRYRLQQLLLEASRQPAAAAASPAERPFGPRWIHQALRDIDRDPVQCGGLGKLAERACVSPAHFSRVFKRLTGMNVTDYVNAKRLVRAKELLLETDDKIESIALACGYQGMRHFYQLFRKLTGVTPRAYRLQRK